MYIDELSWQQYSTLANIAPLPLNEQIRKYNIYINEILEARFAYLHHQMANPQSLGGGVDVQQQEEEEGLPSGCIQFVNNTSDGTQCRFWIETSAPTNYTITWGDGETTTGQTTDDLEGGVGIGNGGNKLQVEYSYADIDTEYTARICFNDISLVTYLEFNGDD
jgi:hypothetical protein